MTTKISTQRSTVGMNATGGEWLPPHASATNRSIDTRTPAHQTIAMIDIKTRKNDAIGFGLTILIGRLLYGLASIALKIDETCAQRIAVSHARTNQNNGRRAMTKSLAITTGPRRFNNAIVFVIVRLRDFVRFAVAIVLVLATGYADEDIFYCGAIRSERRLLSGA